MTLQVLSMLIRGAPFCILFALRMPVLSEVTLVKHWTIILKLNWKVDFETLTLFKSDKIVFASFFSCLHFPICWIWWMDGFSLCEADQSFAIRFAKLHVLNLAQDSDWLASWPAGWPVDQLAGQPDLSFDLFPNNSLFKFVNIELLTLLEWDMVHVMGTKVKRWKHKQQKKLINLLTLKKINLWKTDKLCISAELTVTLVFQEKSSKYYMYILRDLACFRCGSNA